MQQYKFLANLKQDLPAGIVVFLLALPLCLGIALASGAPLFSGLIAGIIGGLVIGALSGSHTSVSGPAAGLTVNIGEHLQIDASFLYSHFKEVDASYNYYFENGVAVPFSGTYKTNAFVPGLGLTYKL